MALCHDSEKEAKDPYNDNNYNSRKLQYSIKGFKVKAAHNTY